MNCASWCRGYYVSQHVPSADWLTENLNEAVVCIGRDDAVVISSRTMLEVIDRTIALPHLVDGRLSADAG